MHARAAFLSLLHTCKVPLEGLDDPPRMEASTKHRSEVPPEEMFLQRILPTRIDQRYLLKFLGASSGDALLEAHEVPPMRLDPSAHREAPHQAQKVEDAPLQKRLLLCCLLYDLPCLLLST